MEYSPSVASIVTMEEEMKYVDRGDPAAADFATGAFTMDGAWHDLDLSAIVPVAGASHLVHFRVTLFDSTAGEALKFRKNGNANTQNIVQTITQEPSKSIDFDVWCMVDANRVMEYNTAFSIMAISFVVRGWLEG